MAIQTDSDILIVGGGMVGASLACALSGQNLRVTVAEGVPLRSAAQPSYDDRSIALAYGSARIFDAMGLWAAIEPQTAAIRRIHISDRGHFGATRLDAAEEGVDALGYVVETRVLGRVLQEALARAPNVELVCPASVEDLRVGDHGVEVAMRVDDAPRTLTAALVIAADGSTSLVRERLQIPVLRWDYGQTAVIANVTAARPHDHVAYERFTDSGPLALLPLPDAEPADGGGRLSLVWTVRSERAEEVLALEDEAFLAALQDRFGQRLGALVRAGVRHAYPLSLLRVKEHVRPRVALIGNAAHTLHPVAGQGFNLGIRDVAALAELLAEAAGAGADPGSPALLQRYASWRNRDHRRVAAFTDGLARVFANPLAPVALARDLGLVAVDLLPSLKHFLARRTMGLAGRLPRLGRGLPLR
ncbi:MAG: 2-octaprenyl-6-methoxyphenyl hydroxylase [Gammaproteobacteria bacterium]